MQLRYVLVLVLVCVLLLPVLLLAVVVLILLLYSARDYLYPQIASGVVPFNSLRGGRAMRNAFSPVFNSRCVVGPCPTSQGPTSHHYCCVLVLTASHRATAGQSYPYPDIHVAYIKYKTGWASCGPQSPVPRILIGLNSHTLTHSTENIGLGPFQWKATSRSNAGAYPATLWVCPRLSRELSTSPSRCALLPWPGCREVVWLVSLFVLTVFSFHFVDVFFAFSNLLQKSATRTCASGLTRRAFSTFSRQQTSGDTKQRPALGRRPALCGIGGDQHAISILAGES